MSNKELYKKTIGFSLRRVLWDILSLVILLACGTIGYVLGEKFAQNGIVGLIIGAVVGIILTALISHFISYLLKAGQIAMMTRGITEGELPDNVIAEGKKAVKERFGAVAAYYAITNAIKGIFNQLGRLITNVGQKVGGDTGGAKTHVLGLLQQLINEWDAPHDPYAADVNNDGVVNNKDLGLLQRYLSGWGVQIG